MSEVVIFRGSPAVLKMRIAAAQHLAVSVAEWFDQIEFGPAAGEIHQMMKHKFGAFRLSAGRFFCKMRVGIAGMETPRRW